MTKIDLNVDVHHLARVEGHGNIRVAVADGKLLAASWEVIETPRYFEVMLRGRSHDTAHLLTSRICGICSISHSLVSLEATEDAFGVEIPECAARLRLLAKHAETLQSHALHLFFLAAPDFLGLASALPLIESNPEVVGLAARLKGLANRLSDLAAGRTTHPVRFAVGGVTSFPTRDALLGFRDELVRSHDDWEATAGLLETFEIPDFARETEFVSLDGEGTGYPYIGRRMCSTDGVRKGAGDYAEMTNEWVPANSTSKWCKLSRDAFAVGPLARFNNNHAALGKAASGMAERFGLAAVCHNPFMANVARLVEAVQATEDAIAEIDALVAPGAMLKPRADVTPRAGSGVGAVEAPRGILYHCYEYDDAGIVVGADCVIPTTQNHANIQADLEALVPRFATEKMTDAKLELLCSMLVRAYDPCISCSVH